MDVAELAAAYTGMLETELGASLTSLFVQLLRRNEVRGELFTADPYELGIIELRQDVVDQLRGLRFLTLADNNAPEYPGFL